MLKDLPLALLIQYLVSLSRVTQNLSIGTDDKNLIRLKKPTQLPTTLSYLKKCLIFLAKLGLKST